MYHKYIIPVMVYGLKFMKLLDNKHRNAQRSVKSAMIGTTLRDGKRSRLVQVQATTSNK